MIDLTENFQSNAFLKLLVEHKDNPIVAERLNALLATLLLVEEQPFDDLVRKEQEAHLSSWWPAPPGHNPGQINTVASVRHTGKSVWGQSIGQLYNGTVQAPRRRKK